MKRLNIVSTLPEGSWGGSEELWCRAALRLTDCGINVRASIPWKLNIPNRLAKSLNARFVSDKQRPFGLLGRVRRRLIRDPRLGFLSNHQADLTLVSQAGGFDGLMWLRECYRLGLKYAVVCQAGGEYCWPSDSEANDLRTIFAAAEAVYFVSESNLRLMRKQIVSDLPNASVVRNPFNVDYGASPIWPVSGSSISLACVGRLHAYHKGQDLILELLRTQKWRDRAVEVTFYGNGPNERTLKEYAEVHQIGAARFAGSVSDIEGIWRNHHALILPSRCEGLPLAIVEAMLCGRTCITTDVAGNAELIGDNLTGFVAAAPTLSHLDEAMERMWRKRGELRSMGQRAAAAVRVQVPADPAAIFGDKLIELASRGAPQI